jgi:hypothetical protein
LIIELYEKGGGDDFLESRDREEYQFRKTMMTRRKSMRKIIHTVMVCALALVFLSVSDVFAVDTTKLANKEFKFTGIAKRYDAAGGYDGSAQITQGTLIFGNPEDAPGVISAHNIASDYTWSQSDGLFEYYCFTELGSYTPGLNKITSTQCSMECWTAGLIEFVTTGEPVDCTARIVFSSNTEITGTITVPDIWGEGTSYVLTLNGKFMGKYPPEITGTSLRDQLRNKAPEGLRKSFWK